MLAATLAAATPARAGRPAAAPSALGHRVERVVAGADRLFALEGGEVLTFAGDGRPLGRCAGLSSPPRTERHDLLGAPDAEEVLGAAGLPDDDSTPEAEDALADEGLGPRRRQRPATVAGIVPRALAATGGAGEVWIATSSGAFRGDERGCRPAGLEGRDLLLVATSGNVVVAATEDLLFRRAAADGDEATDDDTATFMVTAGLATRPRALAVWADGTPVVADDDGVIVFAGEGTADRILDRPTDALVICGDSALAFADDGVYRWTAGGSPVRTADRPPVRALACGPALAARFVATGLGVWSSPDGVTWIERHETLGRSVAGAATEGTQTWLALDDGLSAIDLTVPESDVPLPDRIAPGPVGFTPLSNERLAGSALPWPWVTAMLGAERTTDRRIWEVMLLLTFPLGRGPTHVDAMAVAAERSRRDQALAREQIDLAAAASAGAGEEGAARLESVLQEREALR
jgi:hypothetical protein